MPSSEIGKRPASCGASVATLKSHRNIFAAVNDAASGRIRQLAERWLGTTRLSGENLMALNPTRADRSIGSFSINIRTGAWADFATGDRGSDIVSFYAYLHGVRQLDAARELARILGVSA
jgi:hypothetical protein